MMTKAERERLERLEKLEQDVLNGRILHYDGLESVVYKLFMITLLCFMRQELRRFLHFLFHLV